MSAGIFQKMLVGCVITYNDMPLIKDCIESLYNKVDKIVAVDGRYFDFPGDGWDSADGTLEYLCSIDKADVISTMSFTELEKRNRYLEELDDGDIVINLDADEFLVGNIPELNSDFGIVELHDGHCGKVQPRATRFFRYREGMRYANVHYTLYYNGKQINSLHKVMNPGFSFDKVGDFKLVHNWHKRSHLRQHNKSLYYKKLIRIEAGYPR
jgi:hypothetical protein